MTSHHLKDLQDQLAKARSALDNAEAVYDDAREYARELARDVDSWTMKIAHLEALLHHSSSNRETA